MALISPISPGQELPRDFLHGPGGFVWWYADLVDKWGNGMVMIWSYGLPFLPGYAHAARSGEPQSPHQRPSLNLAVYELGRPVFYSLQELEPHAAAWRSGRQLVFGDSVWHIDTETGRSHADLNVPIPGGGHLFGSVEITGQVPLVEPAPNDDITGHLWGPLLTPALGTAKFKWKGRQFEIDGDAYVDRNGAWYPLHELGFKAWTWGRVSCGQRQKVFYILWPDGSSNYRDKPTAIGFEFGPGPHPKQVDLRPVFLVPTSGFAGMPWCRSFKLFDGTKLWLEGTATHVVDDGPFYVRAQFAGTDDRTRPVPGYFEWCDTTRVDLTRHRFLVNMRVNNPYRNSMWLPLFEGPVEDRVERLLRTWKLR